MNNQQQVVFGLNEDGELFWSTLTEAGMVAPAASDGLWTEWAQVLSSPASSGDLAHMAGVIVCGELGF